MPTRYSFSRPSRARPGSAARTARHPLVHAGRSLWISGSESKLCSGGGDEVIHSRVLPSQGSLPAIFGPRMLFRKLMMKTMRASAIKKAPMVEIRFQISQPWPDS